MGSSQNNSPEFPRSMVSLWWLWWNYGTSWEMGGEEKSEKFSIGLESYGWSLWINWLGLQWTTIHLVQQQRKGSLHKWRLDQCLAMMAWTNQFPEAKVTHEIVAHFDYLPLWLDVNPIPIPKKEKIPIQSNMASGNRVLEYCWIGSKGSREGQYIALGATKNSILWTTTIH